MMGTLDVIKIESVDCGVELENGGENVGIDHENIMCRICLDSNTKLYNLHSYNCIEAFASVIGIEVSATDGLPQRICNICATLLQKMARFKEKCLKVHTMLIDALVKRSAIKTDVIHNLDEIRSLQLSRTKILNLDLVPSTENNIKSPKVGVHGIKEEFPYTQFQTEYDDCLSINNRGNPFTSDDLLDNIDADIKDEIVEKTVETIIKTEETIDLTKETTDETEETTFETETFDETEETTFETETFDETEEDVIILVKYSQPSTQKKKKDDSHTCPKCSRQFNNALALDRHLEIFNGRWLCEPCLRPCLECGEDFVTAEDFNNHLEKDHNNQTNNQLESIERRKTLRVRENDVDQTKDSQTTFVLVKSQKKKNNLFCDICAKDNFQSASALRLHVRVHTGEKPYSCDLCHKSFRIKAQLKRHMPVHSDEKQYICKYCDKTFRLYTSLTRHERVVHRNARRFQCEICLKRFQENSSLKLHINTVHLMTPHLPVATQ